METKKNLFPLSLENHGDDFCDQAKINTPHRVLATRGMSD